MVRFIVLALAVLHRFRASGARRGTADAYHLYLRCLRRRLGARPAIEGGVRKDLWLHSQFRCDRLLDRRAAPRATRGRHDQRRHRPRPRYVHRRRSARHRPVRAARTAFQLDDHGWSDPDFTPVDHGYFAFVYDKRKVANPPSSFEELIARPESFKIVIEDPRSDTPGLGLVLWIKAAYGDRAPEIWTGFEAAHRHHGARLVGRLCLFLKGEADMVLSYTTSPAYHAMAESDPNYGAATFDEGHVPADRDRRHAEDIAAAGPGRGNFSPGW